MGWDELRGGRDLAGPVCAVFDGAGGLSLVAVVTNDGQGGVKILRGFRGRG
jgi:hypothetical protein